MEKNDFPMSLLKKHQKTINTAGVKNIANE